MFSTLYITLVCVYCDPCFDRNLLPEHWKSDLIVCSSKWLLHHFRVTFEPGTIFNIRFYVSPARTDIRADWSESSPFARRFGYLITHSSLRRLIRPHRCAGWSESSLSTCAILSEKLSSLLAFFPLLNLFWILNFQALAFVFWLHGANLNIQ